MAYTGAAVSLVRDRALRVPTSEWRSADSTSALSFWPPGYPVAIAVPVALGVSPVQGGRIVNVVAAAVSAAALVGLVGGVVGVPAGVAAALVVFATPAVGDVHLSVLSEPLLIALLLLVLWAMVGARERVWLLGVLGAACVMVRYAGAAAAAAATVWVLLDRRQSDRLRVIRAAPVALLPAVTAVWWVVRTALAHDRHGAPRIAVYGGWRATLAEGWDTISGWLVPSVAPGVLRSAIAVAFAIVLAAFVLAAARDARVTGRRHRAVRGVGLLLGAASLLVACYCAVVVAARAFVGGGIPFDGRILAPLIVLLEVMAVTGIAYWWRAFHRPMRILVGAVALAWVGASTMVTVGDAVYATTEGSDLAERSWRDSPMLAWVRANGAGHALYSNWPPAVYFHAGRPARELPDSDDVREGALADFASTLAARNGLVVGFDVRNPDVLPPDSLARLAGLREVVRFADGAVWSAP